MTDIRTYNHVNHRRFNGIEFSRGHNKNTKTRIYYEWLIFLHNVDVFTLFVNFIVVLPLPIIRILQRDR